jgi:hypothetical protein
MAIQNRDNGLSQQREVLPGRVSAAVTGESYTLITVPFACAVQAAFFSVSGLSGSPQYMLRALRFTSAGATSIDLGISNITIAGAVGLSGGAQGWSGLRTLGSSLLLLQAGDAIVLGTAGANTGADDVAVSLVVQKTQDIVQHFGLNT